MRRPPLLCLLAMAGAIGCGETGGETPSEGSSGDPTGSTSTTVTDGSTTSAMTTAPGTGTGTGTGTADGTADGTATAGGATQGDSGDGESSTGSTGPLVPADCRTLLEEDPSTPDGVYSLHIGGDPEAPTFAAYCDMTTAGGGWTLVGRSAPGEWGDLPFGWYEATGDLADDTIPYSLDAAAAQLQLSEVLIGTYAAGKTWGANAYILTVPASFVAVYRQAPYEASITTVIGTCMPRGGPEHLRYIGWTEAPDVFHIANTMNYEDDGLEDNRWDTDDPDCEDGGNLYNLQGMIMVR